MTPRKKVQKTKTSEDPIEWAQKAFDKLKESKKIKFKSKLEEQVANLLSELGVTFEYESCKVPYAVSYTHLTLPTIYSV